MAVQTKRQGLHTLQQQEGVEGRDGGAGIPQQDGPNVSNKSGGTDSVHKADTVVAGIGVCNGRVLAVGLPVELAGVHDDAAQCGAVAADELGGGVEHNISAVLNRADQIGRAEGIVDDQRQTVPVGDGGNGVDVWNVRVGVAQSLQINCLGVILNGIFHFCKIMRVDEGSGDTELGQGVGQQVVAAAVNGLLRHDVVASLGQRLNGIGDGGGTRSGSQSRHATLQCCEALFQHILGRVGQAAINITGIRQPEAGRRMGAVAEDIGSGLVNRYCTGIRSGIGLFLTNVKLQGFKLIIVIHGLYLFQFIV